MPGNLESADALASSRIARFVRLRGRLRAIVVHSRKVSTSVLKHVPATVNKRFQSFVSDP